MKERTCLAKTCIFIPKNKLPLHEIIYPDHVYPYFIFL